MAKDLAIKQEFKTLRDLASLDGGSLATLEKATGLSRSSVSKKITGKREWSRWEMYQILTFFDLPLDLMPVVFPKDIYESSKLQEMLKKGGFS